MKIYNLIGNLTSSLEKEILPEVDILSCLDGFTLVLSSGGDVIYASDNITRYLGIRSVSWNWLQITDRVYVWMYPTPRLISLVILSPTMSILVIINSCSCSLVARETVKLKIMWR